MTVAEFPKTHNLPPDLASMLEIETSDLKTRADDLVAAVGRVVVADAEGAKKATLLLGQIISHGKLVESTRETRKAPFLNDGRTVDQHFGRLKEPLIGTDPKGKLGGAGLVVQNMIQAYQDEQARLADIERKRLEEEARLAREAQAAAERAQREAEEALQREADKARQELAAAQAEAQRAGNAEAAAKAALAFAEAETARQAEESQRRIDNELAARVALDNAAELDRRAAASKVTAIDTGYGVKASNRTKYVVTIDDLTVAIKHARKLNESAIREAVQKILDAQSRAGVRTIPGCTVAPESTIQIRGAA